MTPYVTGLVLAVLTFLLLKFARMDRDAAVYPVVLMVIATYYLLFAAIDGSTQAIVSESIGAAVFIAIAIIGYRFGAWIVAAGMVAHGAFDMIHASIIADSGVPVWWPAFCASIDVALGVLLATSLLRKSEVTGAVGHALKH